MFPRFINLCNKPVHSVFFSLRKYSKKVAHVSKDRRNRSHMFKNDQQFKEIPKNALPIITCKRKEFNFYQGQVYKKFEPVPLASKCWSHPKAKGDYFWIHPHDICTEDNERREEESKTFNEFGFHPQLTAKLESLGWTNPTHIQKIGIPPIMLGQNTTLTAETGCGKTLAYLAPMINQVLQWKKLKERKFNTPLGLIIAPTRELALQIGYHTRRIANEFDIKTKVITGGKTSRMLLNPNMQDVDIVIGTLGALSKLATNKIYRLHDVRHVVLDEADTLFHESFEEKLKIFMLKIPIGFSQNFDEFGFPMTSQITLASATMPKRINEVLGHILNTESIIKVSTENVHRIHILQKFMRLGALQKPIELLKFVKSKVTSNERLIIFSNNNRTCDWISLFLNESQINTVHLSGDTPVSIKKGKYATFLSGKAMVLSTTNVASRGLDTTTIRHILNYDFPFDTSDYIHRCGRTGRIGSPKNCQVTNFICNPQEIRMTQIIEMSARRYKPIPIVDLLIHDKKIANSGPNLPEQMFEEEPEMDPAYIEELERDNIPY